MEGVPGVEVGETSGAMYSTIVVHPDKFKDMKDTIDFSKRLQVEENVFVFPGELFGKANFVRLVICACPAIIEEACVRIRRFCERHKK
jgi:tyrosine aminotransferase